MEATLVVVGLSHQAAPLAVRERFWIRENHRYEVLRQLCSAEGIEEVAVLCTRCRTEFLVWASESSLAANSLLQFLSLGYRLKPTEWEHFHRLLFHLEPPQMALARTTSNQEQEEEESSQQTTVAINY